MGGASLLFLFLPLFFGAMFLILWVGFQSIEEERSKETETGLEIEPGYIEIPRFFAKEAAEPKAEVPPYELVDDKFVVVFRDYLQKEQDLADRFVSQPSVANLYRQPDSDRAAS